MPGGAQRSGIFVCNYTSDDYAREVIISAGPTSRNEWMLNRGSGVNSMTQQFIFRKLNNTRIFSEIGECNVLGLSYS
jgi:hypothetical protein